ncbi:SDR family NAD(P)-dependent oxidoreductase [Brevibacterium renqingii]|uniref:SDR family NAD(P)-dependent oxidoreductase n=1 Tax=Brevibacterium renqingii TaxID=2776916 RepID=UPI001AE0D816|nr:SDR family NAD(P)-dependent oxidoreductase [Brevibacterium renqingii]
MSSTDSAPVLAVTGGASGIGWATVEAWCRDGGAAVILDFSREKLDAALAGAPSDWSLRGIIVDVTDRAAVDDAFASIAETEQRLDALVNCAGNAKPVPSAEMSDSDWEALLEVHLTGTMRACRAAHSLLKNGGGAIVNISSVAGVAGMPKRASYNTVKHGLIGLTKSLAVEWASDGIRVNAIGPGYTWTPFNAALEEQGLLDPAPITKRIPLNRWAQPEEIAAGITFLAGPKASFVTGHTLMVDGGMTIDGNWYE